MQIFHRRANAITKLLLIGVPTAIAALAFVAWQILWSPYVSGVGMAREQPVLFSHKHHVAENGIHCRYCHTTVESAATAGFPPTETCMNCHAYILTQSPLLAPVHASWQSKKPLPWVKTQTLPDHVFFNHSIHVNKGVACVTCHGRVDQRPLMWKAETFYMRWCLDCHRDPAPRLRPREAIYDMTWSPPAQREERRALAAALVKQYGIRKNLDECYMCHR